jgi:hypothetical protein
MLVAGMPRRAAFCGVIVADGRHGADRAFLVGVALDRAFHFDGGRRGGHLHGVTPCVHIILLFIINEHAIFTNVKRPALAADLGAYRHMLQKWMPKAEVRPAAALLDRLDGVITVRTGGKTIRYLVEEKRHFRHQDAAVVVEQLNRLRANLPRGYADDRLLLLAPHVRAQQASILERAGIDYVDLAGNVHLNAPGLFVHVEGKQPAKVRSTAPTRPNKGWVKAVMALLVKPDLVNAPYRMLAKEGDVALGTLAKCVSDLTLRGLIGERRGERIILDRPALVALWVQAYIDGLRPKLAERRFQVRVDDKPQLWARLRDVLAGREQRWALTGADAAERRDHFFRADETEIYAPIRFVEDREVQKALVAQPAVRGGNVLVIEPPGPLAIPKATIEAVPVAPDLLAYAELRYRGSEQALEAAELLLPRVLGNATDRTGSHPRHHRPRPRAARA